MDALSIASIVVAVLSVIITYWYNRKLCEVNERMYRLAYEQDLLRRKEEHFKELKGKVIKPLLNGDTDKVDKEQLTDLMKYHYPNLKDLGSKLRDIVTEQEKLKELRNNIADALIESVKKSLSKDCEPEAIESLIDDLSILAVPQLKELSNPNEIRKHTKVKSSNHYYRAFIRGISIAKCSSEEGAKKTLEKATKQLAEAIKSKLGDIEKIKEQQRELESNKAKLRTEIEEQLRELLNKSDRTLTLINNELCPIMKGEEVKPTPEEEKIIETLKEEFKRTLRTA